MASDVRFLTKSPDLEVWPSTAETRWRRVVTGYPGARAGSAEETRKVEITESEASNLMPDWMRCPEFDSVFVLVRILRLISHLEKINTHWGYCF